MYRTRNKKFLFSELTFVVDRMKMKWKWELKRELISIFPCSAAAESSYSITFLLSSLVLFCLSNVFMFTTTCDFNWFLFFYCCWCVAAVAKIVAWKKKLFLLFLLSPTWCCSLIFLSPLRLNGAIGMGWRSQWDSRVPFDFAETRVRERRKTTEDEEEEKKVKVCVLGKHPVNLWKR